MHGSQECEHCMCVLANTQEFICGDCEKKMQRDIAFMAKRIKALEEKIKYLRETK